MVIRASGTPIHNLHATILHQMGLDPNRLSYFYNGLDQKLVGIEGAEVIRQIVSAGGVPSRPNAAESL